MNKRVLVLTPRFPYPMIGGDRIRILHICRALREHYRLTLLSLCETEEELSYRPDDGIFETIERIYLPRWKSYLHALGAIPTRRPLQLAYYTSAEFRSRLQELAPQHDLVLAHLVRTGQYLDAIHVPKVLEMTDAISMNYETMGKLSGSRNWKRVAYGLERGRLNRYEKKVVKDFDRVWLTSQRDAAYLGISNDPAVEVIPNGVNLDSFPYREPGADADAIVFIGNMVSLQNQDACRYFVREILPRVRERIPVRFRIIGNTPESVRQIFSGLDGVDMVGRVESISDAVQGGFCGVCSVRAGAGIQNKVLEYMALGLPCVTSEIGRGGVMAEDGKELLVYRSSAEATGHVIHLYRNALLRAEIARNARQLVEDSYDWNALFKRFRSSAASVLEGSESHQA